ncbi:MAG TPA: DUF2066 domain-containing protein [Hyphomicrobiaceae bacterium]|nr:DUF2066 domain-containing protein [Hyphomicrobiaceae bacterium]
MPGRLALALAATVAVSLSTGAGAAADDSVFTVANYPVEARADNAVAAKTKALAEGQQAAFRSLLKRLVPVTSYQRLRQLRQVSAGEMIEGVSVRSERNSTTDYIASLDFSFQANAVRDLLNREGIPFTDEQASTLILVPLWRSPGAPPAEHAAWTNVWKGLDLEHTLTPAKLQGLKREISPQAVNALAEGDGNAIRGLVAAYGNELVLVAVAEQDMPARRLHVALAGRDAVGAFLLKRAYRLDPADPGYASEFAAVVSLGILEGRWKSMRSAGGGGARLSASAPSSESGFMIAVAFQGMSEWQDISRRLSAAPGIEDLDVAGLSARGARVSLRYPGGPERLAEVLAQQGLSLRNSGGSWVLALQ